MANTRQRLDAFLDDVESRRPGTRQVASFVQESGDEAIHFPSPTNIKELSFWIWIDDCDEISITFGDWHTHSSTASAFTDGEPYESIAKIVIGILDSRFVIASDVDGDYIGFTTVVWIDDAEAVAAMFSHDWSPTQIRVQSWDGKLDRTITAGSPPV